MNRTPNLPWVLAAIVCVAGAAAQEPALAPEMISVSGEQAPQPAEEIMLNFRGVPLDTVLDHLSEAAGFIIVRDVNVSGTVTVWSHQPLDPDEAVALLNAILGNRGYAAIRQGRTLTIVDRESAKQRGIPVRMGSDPSEISATDEMITQIIPVRYADVKQLLENIQELLPSYAVATVNESTNAIVLTDTQANVRRMAEIVTALDDSISGISEMKVFHLSNATASETADLVNEVFEVKDTGQSQGGSGRGGMRDFFSRMRGGPPGMGGGGGGDSSGNSQSAARRAASNVVAVADERSNSVVVGAPTEMMPLVEALVEELDGLPEELPAMRVFPLQYADAEETADLINELFNPTSGASGTANGGSQRIGRGMGPGGMMGRTQPQGGGNQQSATSEESTVNAVADLRTNSVVVTAVRESMVIVEQMVKQLDANPAKDKKVYVYSLENADAEEVAEILQETFEESSSSSGIASRAGTTSQNTSTTQKNTGR